MKSDTKTLLLICGLAGSGHSTALHYLADAGYSAVDNLPLFLFNQLIAGEIETHGRRLAVSVDVRTSGFTASGFIELVADIRRRLGKNMMLIFLTASPQELLRRYNATRRHHPLVASGGLTLPRAIAHDAEGLASIEAVADSVIDTTGTVPSDFRQQLLAVIGASPPSPLPVLISSFSYRTALPQSADMVLDMRFLQNPHWREDLADKTGRDAAVQAYIASDPAFQGFMAGVMAMLEVALPLYQAQGRPQWGLAFGCTGGRHRSVFAAEYVAQQLREAKIGKGKYDVRLTHYNI